MASELGWQAWLTIAVVVATLTMLLWERFSPDKVLVAAVAILVASGVLTPSSALAGFWNRGVLTIALLFVLVAALKTTGAIRWVGDWVLGAPRGELRTQARLMGFAAPLSAFVNNTPIVAMLTSAVEHWTKRSGVMPSKLLMPMNYATILGGMCTLLGTSTNLIVAGLVLQDGSMPSMHMFTPLGVGGVAALAGLGYLLTVGRWLLPARRSAVQQAANTREYMVEMMVEPGGVVDGRTIGEAGLRRLAGSYLVELMRGDCVHVAVGPTMPLRGGDRLVFAGETGAVRELRGLSGLSLASDHAFSMAGAPSQRLMLEMVVSQFNPAVGRTLVESAFRTRYNSSVIAMSRHGGRLDQKLGDVVLQAGDTLLVETGPGFVEQYGNSPEFLVVNELDGAAVVDRRRAKTVLAVMGLMIAANTLLGIDILFSALGASVVVVLARCLSLVELRRSFDLRLLVVIASSFALGAAIQQTGVAGVVAGGLTAWAGVDPFWTLVLVYLLAVVFTEMLTNNAAAVLMFPIGLSAARQLGVDPMPFVIAVMMGASAGFITPIGYQTNLMIYGPGGYRFTDYVRVGAPLSLVVGAAVLWAIPRFWPF